MPPLSATRVYSPVMNRSGAAGLRMALALATGSAIALTGCSEDRTPRVVASAWEEDVPPGCYANPVEIVGRTLYAVPADELDSLAASHPLPVAERVPAPEASVAIAGEPQFRGWVHVFDDGYARFDTEAGTTTWYTDEETVIEEMC
jgi:translation elongation factor EF-G